MSRRRLLVDSATLAKLQRLHRAGLSVRAIARELGLPASTVHRRIVELKTEARSGSQSDEQAAGRVRGSGRPVSPSQAGLAAMNRALKSLWNGTGPAPAGFSSPEAQERARSGYCPPANTSSYGQAIDPWA